MIKKNCYVALILLIFMGCSTYLSVLEGLQGSALKRGDFLFNAGRYSEATEVYRKILKDSSFGEDAGEAQYRLAFTLCYYKNPQQDYAASLKEFQKVISRYPRSPYRKESENMIFLLTALASQKQQLSDEQSKAKQLEEKLAELQRLEMEAEQRRTRSKQE